MKIKSRNEENRNVCVDRFLYYKYVSFLMGFLCLFESLILIRD